MTQRILLVRHGRSSYQHDGRWLDLAGVREFERGYNSAGIRDDDLPPPQLIEEVRTALIVASDMPRALASVSRLVPGCEPHVSPLLRELTVEVPTWIPFRMPVEVWDTLQYWNWTYRLMRKLDHDDVRRAGKAADWLLERVGREPTTCVVTHGMFRRVLHAQLAMRGWKPVPGRRTFANWSVWSYAREAETPSSRVKLAV